MFFVQMLRLIQQFDQGKVFFPFPSIFNFSRLINQLEKPILWRGLYHRESFPKIFFPGLKMNQENSPEKYLRFTLVPRFLFGKVGYCPCFPSGYLLPDGYPRPQRIRDGLEEIEGVSKPQQLQNSEIFPPNGRRN